MSIATTEIASRVLRLIDDRHNRQRIAVGSGTKLRSDLRMGSIDLTDLWLDLENEFGVEITEGEFEVIDSVGETIELIGMKKGPRG